MPGFLRNDGFKIALHTQKQYIDNKLYYADNLAYMPRGFDSDIYAENYSMCSLDYALPIYLGDVNWGRVAYFKRLQLVPFIDYAVLDKSWSNKAYSAGATLMVDSYLLRIGVPVSFGFRYSYNRENVGLLVNKNKVELMFSVDLQ